MTFEGYIVLGTVLAVFIALQRRGGAPPDLIFLGGLVTVTLCGVITPQEALAGFANPAVITIGALFVVAAAMRTTGALDRITYGLLGRAKTKQAALLRLIFPVVGLSALINNTPIVAMLVPSIIDWCRARGISPSRMLLPISYLAILGGACTLIGTSTNFVVNGMLIQAKMPPMHLFEIGYVGLPCAIVGGLYLIFVGRHLLPNRTDLVDQLGEQRREYLVEMMVLPQCRLVGQTVETAGLRNLPGLFLIEIDRGGEVITPVAPEDIIREDDRLIFTGIVSTIVDLEKIPGLVPAADTGYEMRPEEVHRRHLTEVVLSNTSPLIGSTIKEAKFRQLYNAAVVAVHRNGVRITNKVGNIRLETGDTLLLQTSTKFHSTFRNSRDFFLVSSVEGSEPRRYHRTSVALGLLAMLVVALVLVSLGLVKGFDSPGMLAIVAVAIAGLMVGARCIPMAQARTALDLQVLIAIAAAIGLGGALDESGAAESIAEGLVHLVGDQNPYLLLAAVYLLTVIFTELMTNTAVAAMMFPLAVAVAGQIPGEINARPFIMAIAMAASCSFITPIGYQTNLMVMGPGGYRPVDYLRVGLPLSLLVGATAITLIPQIWPFH